MSASRSCPQLTASIGISAWTGSTIRPATSNAVRSSAPGNEDWTSTCFSGVIIPGGKPHCSSATAVSRSAEMP